MVEGSTGGAGLRGLEGEKPTPLSMTVLYFDQQKMLQAYDDITVGGTGQAQVNLERHVVRGPEAAGVPATPTPTAERRCPRHPDADADRLSRRRQRTGQRRARAARAALTMLPGSRSCSSYSSRDDAGLAELVHAERHARHAERRAEPGHRVRGGVVHGHHRRPVAGTPSAARRARCGAVAVRTPWRSVRCQAR